MIPIRALLFLVACALIQPALAAPRAFTIAEEAIIERNEVLREVVKSDPVLVRRVLDALKTPRQGKKQRNVFGNRQRGEPESGGVDTGEAGATFDPGANPDLTVFQRGSPEAAHDLFQLLKKAAGR